MCNNTSSQEPERAIDYRDKYLSHISDGDKVHVIRCIYMGFTEGKKVALREMLKVFAQTKRTSFDVYMRRQLALSKNYLKALCLKYDIFYVVKK